MVFIQVILLLFMSLAGSGAVAAIQPIPNRYSTVCPYVFGAAGQGSTPAAACSAAVAACNAEMVGAPYAPFSVSYDAAANVCRYLDKDGGRPNQGGVSVAGYSCPANSTSNGSACTCDAGYSESGGQCVSQACPAGQHRDASGQCVPNNCPAGAVWSSAAGTCLCSDGHEPANGQCAAACPPDTDDVNGQCLPKCPSGQTRKTDGTCSAPDTCEVGKEHEREYTGGRPSPVRCFNGCQSMLYASTNIAPPGEPSKGMAYYLQSGEKCTIDPGNEGGPPGEPQPPQPPASGASGAAGAGGAGGGGGAGGSGGSGGQGGAGGAGGAGNANGGGQGGQGGSGGGGGSGGSGGSGGQGSQGGQGGQGGEGGDAGDVMCKLFPAVLACASMQVPEGGDGVGRATRNVSVMPETAMGMTGACPADPTIGIAGASIALPFFSTGCVYLVNYVRPMAIALAGFAALMIGIGGLRSGD